MTTKIVGIVVLLLTSIAPSLARDTESNRMPEAVTISNIFNTQAAKQPTIVLQRQEQKAMCIMLQYRYNDWIKDARRDGYNIPYRNLPQQVKELVCKKQNEIEREHYYKIEPYRFNGLNY